MIYSLETIPMVLLSRIMETNDLSLLSDENLNEEELNTVWDEIREDYTKHEDSIRNKKIDSLRNKLDKNIRKYNLILISIETLKYGSDKDILKILESYGYSIKNDFKSGLELITKQVVNLKNIIDRTRKELETYLDVKKSDVSIYKVIVDLSVGLEMPLDTNKITAIEFIYYRKALEIKVKSIRNGRRNN